MRRQQSGHGRFAVRQIGKPGTDQRRRLWDWFELERDLRDDCQRSLRADEQLAQVVACHVLDHPPAGVKDLAVRLHPRQPDHIIAKRPQPKPPRSTGIRRQSAAQLRAFPLRNIDRQPQPFAAQNFIEPGDRYTGFNGDSHIAGRKLDDAIEPAGDELYRSLAKRRAVFKRGAASDGHDRPLGSGKVFHEKRAQLLLRRGRELGGGFGASGAHQAGNGLSEPCTSVTVYPHRFARYTPLPHGRGSKDVHVGVQRFIVSIFARGTSHDTEGAGSQ